MDWLGSARSRIEHRLHNHAFAEAKPLPTDHQHLGGRRSLPLRVSSFWILLHGFSSNRAGWCMLITRLVPRLIFCSAPCAAQHPSFTCSCMRWTSVALSMLQGLPLLNTTSRKLKPAIVHTRAQDGHRLATAVVTSCVAEKHGWPLLGPRNLG